MFSDVPPTDYTGILNQVLLIITALGSLVAAVGVLISKIRGDRIEKNQADAKVAVVEAKAAVVEVKAAATRAIEQNRVIIAKQDEVKTLVAAPVSAALESTASALSERADLTQSPDDAAAATVARAICEEHRKVVGETTVFPKSGT